MRVDRQRHQINPVRTEGPAADEPSRREGESAPEAVLSEGIDRVVRAARVETTRGHAARSRGLVRLYDPDGSPHGSTETALAAHGRTGADWDARCIARCTSAANVARLVRAAVGSTRRRYVPRGRVAAIARADSRIRRRREFRTTAFPQCFPIAYPTCGYTPGESGATGTKVARTGPQLARARERCNCPKAVRLWILPTVRAGTGSSAAQTVSRWRPLSRRDFKMALPARVDMRLRKPWVLARFRVFG